jgi:hypothetical protein
MTDAERIITLEKKVKELEIEQAELRAELAKLAKMLPSADKLRALGL